ncbi:hypothetical protein D3C78_1370230 [compost metagenome]
MMQLPPSRELGVQEPVLVIMERVINMIVAPDKERKRLSLRLQYKKQVLTKFIRITWLEQTALLMFLSILIICKEQQL